MNSFKNNNPGRVRKAVVGRLAKAVEAFGQFSTGERSMFNSSIQSQSLRAALYVQPQWLGLLSACRIDTPHTTLHTHSQIVPAPQIVHSPSSPRLSSSAPPDNSLTGPCLAGIGLAGRASVRVPPSRFFLRNEPRLSTAQGVRSFCL